MTDILERFHGRNSAIVVVSTAATMIAILLLLALYEVFSGENEDTKDNLRQLAIYRGEIDARSAIEVRFTELQQKVSGRPELIHADSAALAGAQMQRDIKAIVVGASGDIHSAQMLPPASSNDFEIIAVQYDLSIPLDHLRDLTYAIETHRPYFFIETADITAPQFQNAKTLTSQPMLEVRWTVRGYRWTGAK